MEEKEKGWRSGREGEGVMRGDRGKGGGVKGGRRRGRGGEGW